MGTCLIKGRESCAGTGSSSGESMVRSSSEHVHANSEHMHVDSAAFYCTNTMISAETEAPASASASASASLPHTDVHRCARDKLNLLNDASFFCRWDQPVNVCRGNHHYW